MVGVLVVPNLEKLSPSFELIDWSIEVIFSIRLSFKILVLRNFQWISCPGFENFLMCFVLIF